MPNENIILTGFMGTGKTTVGKLIAKELGYKFVDTDEMIMTRANMTIAEIFKIYGEPAFRKMEYNLALELVEKERLVVSTGGGMLLNSEISDILEGKNSGKRRGIIFCLSADSDAIIARVIADKNIERPLLETDDPKAQISKLLQDRKERYSKFIQIDTTSIPPHTSDITPHSSPAWITKIFGGLLNRAVYVATKRSLSGLSSAYFQIGDSP